MVNEKMTYFDISYMHDGGLYCFRVMFLGRGPIAVQLNFFPGLCPDLGRVFNVAANIEV